MSPERQPARSGPIQIVSDEHAIPFSKGLLAESLTATGLPPERAYQVAMSVERCLVGEGTYRLPVNELQDLVRNTLSQTEGQRYVQRYLQWQKLAAEERPLVVLVGGATGVGKSTLAAQLAGRLGIVRLISTDTVRQVMRAFFPANLIPAIHYSSFDAGGAVRLPLDRGADPQMLGFAEQVRMVNVGVEAMVERAVKEGLRMVVEGVHLVPGFMPAAPGGSTLMLQLVVAVSDESLHRSHFVVRERETDGRRPFRRYVRHFREIRRIQDYILELAADQGTLVVENRDIDQAVTDVVDALYSLLDASAGEEQVSSSRDRLGGGT